MADLELDELKREFLAEAREKVRTMEEQIDGGGLPAIDLLQNLAHQLKGAGGSYGFERISAEAAGVESALEQLKDDGATGSLHDGVQRSILRLRAEIENRSSELSLAAH